MTDESTEPAPPTPTAPEAPLPKLTKLTKGSWRSKPKHIEASTPLLGTFFVVRLSSGRVNDIEKAFPTKADGTCADQLGYMRALVAEAVVGDDMAPIFTPTDLKDELDPGEFWQLWREVTDKLNMRTPAKN